MKHLLLIMLATCGPLGMSFATAWSSEPPRPNIVVILADDMGFSDIGCYGSEIMTPNLDKLAAGGLRFTQFYNTGRCCPTRAALLTGLYSHQAGVGHMTDTKAGKSLPGYVGHLNHRCLTIAEALAPAGYHTLMAGKWHVGGDDGMWPVDRGFDHYYGIIGGAANYFRPGTGRWGPLALDHKVVQPEGPNYYTTDAFTDYALKFVKDAAKQDDRPFFLYLAYNAPHWPLQARPEDIEKYRDTYRQGWDALRDARHAKQIELGLLDKSWPLTPRDATAPAWDKMAKAKQADAALRMAVYAAQVDRMDQQIGRVVSTLKELGRLDNTLILFLSDNGGCAEGGTFGFGEIQTGDGAPGSADTFASYGLAWANASNTPFRRYKHWVHEGGIATPLVAHWPAGIKQHGALTNQLGHLIDIMPTSLELAGAKYPAAHDGKQLIPLEGHSLAAVLQGAAAADRGPVFWEHEGNRAVRRGSWKLVAEHGRPWELYDLQQDRTELHNMAADHPDTVAEMKTAYEAWASRANVLPWPLNEGKKKQPQKKPQ
ncbi:MAG: arylsulfatase [Planctomycetia bacterium]|nr:arylsulfatase [Planctomycetia bacterium]